MKLASVEASSTKTGCQFHRLARPAEIAVLAEILDFFIRLPAARLQRRPDRAWRHDIGADAPLDKLLCECLGVGDDPCLGRGIVQKDRRRLISLDRRRRDDRTACRQMRDRRLGDPVKRIKIGLHRLVEIIGRQILDLLPVLLAAGIDDQDIETAQSGDGLLHQFPAPGLIS